MSDAFSDGKSVVNEVSQHGGESAARMLMENVNNAREDFSQPGLNKVSGGFNNYMTVLSDELQRSGVLPELSVGWAKANMDVIGDGRSISDADIKKFEHQSVNSNNPVDQLFIHSLKEQAPKLKQANDDQRGPETVITSQDLDNRLYANSEYREFALPGALGKDPNSLRTQSLLADGGKFFDYLDGIRNDGEKDGQVSRNDLVTFNERVKHDPEFAKQFSPDQVQVAKELDERWDYEGDKIHTNGIFTQNMTRETLAKGLGFQDIPAEELMTETLNVPQLWSPEDELGLGRDRYDRPADEDVRNPVAERMEKAVNPVNPPGDNRGVLDFHGLVNPPDDNHVLDRSSPYADRIIEPCIDAADPVRNILNDATQRVGEGPYQVASRLLPGAPHREIMELTRAMKDDYQDRTGDNSDRMKEMKVGEHLINPDNLQRILRRSPALQNRLRRAAH